MNSKIFDFGTFAHMNRHARQTLQDAELKFYKNHAETLASELESMVDELKAGRAVVIQGMTIKAEPGKGF